MLTVLLERRSSLALSCSQEPRLVSLCQTVCESIAKQRFQQSRPTPTPFRAAYSSAPAPHTGSPRACAERAPSPMEAKRMRGGPKGHAPCGPRPPRCGALRPPALAVAWAVPNSSPPTGKRGRKATVRLEPSPPSCLRSAWRVRGGVEVTGGSRCRGKEGARGRHGGALRRLVSPHLTPARGGGAGEGRGARGERLG